MKYAGFWVRLKARLIDVLVLLPAAALYVWATDRSLNAALTATIPYALLLLAYFPFFHGWRGQTPGKRFSGLVVANPDGGRISWGNALRRSAVDMVWTAAWCIAEIAAISDIPAAMFGSSEHHGRLIQSFMPTWFHVAQNIIVLWALADIVSMLVSKHKRALHDFLGGTIVIYAPDEAIQPIAQHGSA